MLSDEEREAIEKIDYIQDFIIENGQYNADVNDMEYFSKVLNLIEKQSKEIEELKEKDTANLAYYDQIYQNGIYTGQRAVEDKIKAKIEKLDEAIKVNKECAKDNADRITVRLLNDEINELKKARNVLESLLEKE